MTLLLPPFPASAEAQARAAEAWWYGCGCCGREVDETQMWCPDCEGHVIRTSPP